MRDWRRWWLELGLEVKDGGSLGINGRVVKRRETPIILNGIETSGDAEK